MSVVDLPTPCTGKNNPTEEASNMFTDKQYGSLMEALATKVFEHR